MSIDKIEVWVHDHILKNPTVRHALYGAYQRVLYIASPKIKFEGDIRKLTPDDGYEYLFGYYDKCPWDETGRYILALKARSATAAADSKEKAELVTIDLQDNGKIVPIAGTTSWNVQQGCMAQWLDKDRVLYNDFRDGKNCAVILNLRDGSERILERAVYTLSADKKTALSLDFSRLHRLRPGYGYANVPDSTAGEKCPDKTCIWKIDIESGTVTPLLKYTDFAGFEPRPDMADAEHKVNHLMISPGGDRFMVLHRWFKNGEKYTRLVTCNIDGTGMYNLSDDDFVSHCCWKNDEEILSYLNKKDGGKGYYLMKDRTPDFVRLWPSLVMDGHPTYSYDGRYVVTDTYPDRKRIQSLYVMDGRKVNRIARVFSPFKYGGDVRCDLHPRWSKDGKMICFDGSFDGKRGIYTVDTGKLTDRQNKTQLSENPLISVVIPTHNREELLPRAVRSALNQTYKNIEVIVVSDGSEDGTDSVMDSLSKEDSRVRYLSYHPGRGGNYARNTGIANAAGEYVAFLDDDDEWYKDKLEKQLEIFLSDENIGVVCTGMNSLQEGEDFVTRFIPPAQYDASVQILLRNSIGSTTTVMVRKSLFSESGVFDENLGALQDYDLWVRLCQITKVGVVKEPCVDYWNYKSSGQVSAFTDKYEKAVAYLNEKYKEEVGKLSAEQQKTRKVYFDLLIAKKAIRNGSPKLARKYVHQAAKTKLGKDVIACWGATFFSADTVNRIKAIIRKIR